MNEGLPKSERVCRPIHGVNGLRPAVEKAEIR